MRRADRPRHAKGASLKNLIDAAMSRHGIARQVTAGMIVERMNLYLRETDSVLAQEVRVVSEQFGVVRIGLSHRLYQEKAKQHEDTFREIAEELSDKDIEFRYSLVDPRDMI